jgi:capsule biosynthesis phosphatase
MIPNNKKTIVFDVDDTILFTKDRDYANSYPNQPVVDGMRLLKSQGWYIILMTARGMGRSNGDIASVEKEVLWEIESFSSKYDVPYDQIILGKPWAAYYVDDKNLTPEQFCDKVAEIAEGS